MSGLNLEFKHDCKRGMYSTISLDDHLGTPIGKGDYILYVQRDESDIKYSVGKVIDYSYAYKSITCQMLGSTIPMVIFAFEHVIVMSKEQLVKRYPEIEEL